MSNVDALWLLATVLIGGTFVTIYLVWMIFQKTDLIVSGIYEGTRVSKQYRNLLTLLIPLPLYLTVSAFDLQMALLMLEVSREVAEVRIRSMCYIGTSYALFGTVFSLLMSPYFLLHLRRSVAAHDLGEKRP
jgi:hypothetical protein